MYISDLTLNTYGAFFGSSKPKALYEYWVDEKGVSDPKVPAVWLNPVYRDLRTNNSTLIQGKAKGSESVF